MKSILMIILLCASTASSISSNTRFSVWHRLANRTVTGYKYKASASSNTACVRECVKDSKCDSYAFNRESGTCYLQVETNTSADATDTSTKVFKAFSPCDAPQTKINFTNTDIQWRKNGLEREGDVVCDDAFMNIGDIPAYRCSATGQWTANHWECRQRVWKNPTVLEHLSVPKRPEQGWTVCMTGHPTGPTRFSLNFRKDANNIALHADFRFQYKVDTNKVMMTSQVNGVWKENLQKYYTPSPFPVAVNRSFQMIVRATTLFAIQVFVDDAFIGNYTTPISLDEVTEVFVNKAVYVDTLDLWCDL